MESISPPSLACPSPVSLCSCSWSPQWPLLLHLLTLPCPVAFQHLALRSLSCVHRARAQRQALGTNTSIACCDHGPPFPQSLSGESLVLWSGPALSPDRNLWACFFERDLEAGTPVQVSGFVVESGESQPEPPLHPQPPPSNGLRAHGCPSGPGHRCVVGCGASGAVCRHFPTAWPSYSWCSPTPGPRGAEAFGYQCYWTPETHLAPVAGRVC